MSQFDINSIIKVSNCLNITENKTFKQRLYKKYLDLKLTNKMYNKQNRFKIFAIIFLIIVLP
jgi:hypothetical protein